MMTTMMHNTKNCNNKQTQNDKNVKWQTKKCAETNETKKKKKKKTH